MRLRRRALALTCLLVLPGTAAAQRRSDRPWARPAQTLDRAVGEPRWAGIGFLGRAPDHRWEGLIIGATVVGLAGAILAHEFCNFDSVDQGSCVGRTVVGGLVGAAAGAVVGGLIGGLIPKTAATGEADP